MIAEDIRHVLNIALHGVDRAEYVVGDVVRVDYTHVKGGQRAVRIRISTELKTLFKRVTMVRESRNIRFEPPNPWECREWTRCTSIVTYRVSE